MKTLSVTHTAMPCGMVIPYKFGMPAPKVKRLTSSDVAKLHREKTLKAYRDYYRSLGEPKVNFV